FFFFFFSSRRRHTRFSRDWSSDVCSSDLGEDKIVVQVNDAVGGVHEDVVSTDLANKTVEVSTNFAVLDPVLNVGLDPILNMMVRSEERRVGKECRCRWCEYD